MSLTRDHRESETMESNPGNDGVSLSSSVVPLAAPNANHVSSTSVSTENTAMPIAEARMLPAPVDEESEQANPGQHPLARNLNNKTSHDSASTLPSRPSGGWPCWKNPIFWGLLGGFGLLGIGVVVASVIVVIGSGDDNSSNDTKARPAVPTPTIAPRPSAAQPTSPSATRPVAQPTEPPDERQPPNVPQSARPTPLPTWARPTFRPTQLPTSFVQTFATEGGWAASLESQTFCANFDEFAQSSSISLMDNPTWVMNNLTTGIAFTISVHCSGSDFDCKSWNESITRYGGYVDIRVEDDPFTFATITFSSPVSAWGGTFSASSDGAGVQILLDGSKSNVVDVPIHNGYFGFTTKDGTTFSSITLEPALAGSFWFDLDNVCGGIAKITMT